MDKDNTVYEYNELASEQYRGTRFISSNPKEGETIIPSLTIIASNLSYEEAYALCDITREKNIKAYLESLPEELRDGAEEILDRI